MNGCDSLPFLLDRGQKFIAQWWTHANGTPSDNLVFHSLHVFHSLRRGHYPLYDVNFSRLVCLRYCYGSVRVSVVNLCRKSMVLHGFYICQIFKLRL